MKQQYIKNVVSLEYDSSKCDGCSQCTQVCPHGVFVMVDKRAVLTDKDRCMECGACKRNCARGAINVKEGVGCAAAIIFGTLKGTEPTCGCSGEENKSGCC